MYRLGPICLVACSAPEPKDAPSTPEGDADTDTDTDTDTDSDADADKTAFLSGQVLLEDGTPVPEAKVNLCRGACLTATSDEEGHYDFGALNAWTSALYVFPPPGPELVTPSATLTLADHEQRTIDIVLHPPTASVPMPEIAAEVELSGLRLTAGADTLSLLFEDLPDTLTVAAVDPAEALPIELDGTVLGVWHLGPFKAESEAGLPLRIVNSWALPAGESYRIWVADVGEHSWLDQGTLTVSSDTTTLEGAVRIPFLTTVVLVDD